MKWKIWLNRVALIIAHVPLVLHLVILLIASKEFRAEYPGLLAKAWNEEARLSKRGKKVITWIKNKLK